MAKKIHPAMVEKLGIGEAASGDHPFVSTSGGEIQVKTGSGMQAIATSSTVASAVAKILIKDWAASTAIDTDEVRRATVAAGTIEAGDLIRSNSTRTTGAAFDGTEAGNWLEIAPDIVTSVAGRTGAVVLTEFTDGSVQALFDTVRADAVHQMAAATDLNSLTGTGWFNIQNATNGPAGGGWYYYFNGVHRSTPTGSPATNYGFQLAKRLDLAGTNNLLMRVNTNNSWTPWATLATTDAATTTVAGLMSGADKTKLDGIATGAEVNVQSDWNAVSGDAQILNKPTIPTATTINDTLTSTSTTEALSANQGKVLQDAKAPLASPALTGTPTAPTAAVSTNTTQLATTAYVVGQAATVVPVMDGTAAIGTSNTFARQDHVHASDTSRAPTASPVLTGTPQISGNPKLGSNSGHAQRSFSDITGAAMLMTPTTGTATSTIDPAADIAARFVKPGTAGTKSNASMDIVIGSYAAGVDPTTQVDFRLGASGNTPTATIMSLRSDGGIILNGSTPKTTANVIPGGGTLVAGAATITLTAAATTSRIMLTKTGGVATGVLRVSTKAAGSFIVTSSDNTDTGTFDYVVFN